MYHLLSFLRRLPFGFDITKSFSKEQFLSCQMLQVICASFQMGVWVCMAGAFPRAGRRNIPGLEIPGECKKL